MVMITGGYAALIGLLTLGLSIGVVRHRLKYQVGIGDGGQKRLELWIRSQANLIEYAPLALLMLGCLELNGAPFWLLHLLGAALVIGRILHPWGLLQGSGGLHQGRKLGTILTWSMILFSALALLWFSLIA